MPAGRGRGLGRGDQSSDGGGNGLLNGIFRTAANALGFQGGGGGAGGQGVGLMPHQPAAGYPGAAYQQQQQHYQQQQYPYPYPYGGGGGYPPGAYAGPPGYNPYYVPVAMPYPPPPQQQQHQPPYNGPPGAFWPGGSGGGGGVGAGPQLPPQQQQQGGGGGEEGPAAEQADEQAAQQDLAAMHDGDDDENLAQEAHVDYVPARLKGGRPHPGNVMETRALGECVPPPITYRARIPRAVVERGELSAVQLEAIFSCCQMHERRLPSGERAGWLLGDSTGIGKGRIIAGIMMDNIQRGRDRAVWVTASPFLATQIKRDVKDVGLGRVAVYELSKFSPTHRLDLSGLGPGIMICTYRGLLSKFGRGEGDDEGGGGGGLEAAPKRVQQLVSWLGGWEWDGVLALDEAHKAKNLVTKKANNVGGEDRVVASKSALVIQYLQHRLRNARVIYSSATIATSPDNLECLPRLGLWGRGTAFPTSLDFADAMRSAGLPGLELLALNLKSSGQYLSRCLGFKECEFEVVPAPMSPEFAQLYDDCARQWDDLRRELEIIFPPKAKRLPGDDPPPRALWAVFYGAHQRFFKSLYVAGKVPFVVEQAQAALLDGRYAPVIGIQTTGEAQIKAAMRRPRRRQNGAEEEDEEDEEEICQVASIFEGVIRWMRTEAGLPDHLCDRQLQWLEQNRGHLPPNPLDTLIDALGGPDKVAELTGRTLRQTAHTAGEKGTAKYEAVNVTQRTHERERMAFMNGQKRVAIISEAASTGISLHADRKMPSKDKRRLHFCLELAWGADRVMQQLGRTHRSNQETGPQYKLITSDRLGGDTRFVATVARRLQVLGAITQGHEGAANKTLDLREFNVESSHGDAALKEMLDRAKDEDLSDNPRLRNAYALIESRMGKKLRSLVPRFLNTVLGFELDVQALVMDRFFRMWAQETARAKLDGRFEQGGILNLKGERVELKADDPPRSYIAPPPKELHVAPDRGLALGGGGGGGGGAEAAAAAANPPGAMAAGGEEQEKQKLTVVTLTLDRGLSWDNATQFLLEADHMGGRRGGTGFYLHPRLPGPPRPFLAVERAGSWGGNGKAPTFKMLRPDIGREAYIDRTRDELLDMRFLTPEEAEPLWTARYEASVEQCLHGRGRHCKSGLRLRICHILTFNLTQHWQLVKTLFAKKQWRLRVLRAETTTAPSKRIVGIMLTDHAKRKLERHKGLRLVPAEASPAPVVAMKAEGQGQEGDGQIDIFSLLEEGDDDAMTFASGGAGGGGGGGGYDDGESVVVLDDEDENEEETEDDDLLDWRPWEQRRRATRTLPIKREGGGRGKGSSPARARRRVSMEWDESEDDGDEALLDARPWERRRKPSALASVKREGAGRVYMQEEGDDDEEVEIVEPLRSASASGGGAASAAAAYVAATLQQGDRGGIDEEMDDLMEVEVVGPVKHEPLPPPPPAQAAPIEVVDVSDSDEDGESGAPAAVVAAAEQLEEHQEGGEEERRKLLEAVNEVLDDLLEEHMLEREEVRKLRKRANRQDPAVLAAFMEAQHGWVSLPGLSRAFRRVLGTAV